MGMIPAAVERLAAEFGRLPGIGPKTAQRLTFHCMSATPEATARLSTALRDLHDGVRPCSRCYFIAEGDLCAVCSNPRRDQTVMCVVEEPLDVLAVERSGEFAGVYHVLGGALSPMLSALVGSLELEHRGDRQPLRRQLHRLAGDELRERAGDRDRQSAVGRELA